MSGPADVSNVTSPTFTYSSKQGTSFDCSIDNVTLGVGACAGGTKTFPNLPTAFTPSAFARRTGPSTIRRRSSALGVSTRSPPPRRSTRTPVPAQVRCRRSTLRPSTSRRTRQSTFECRLDTADFAACAAPITLDHLKAGQHKFEVRAIDQAGNIGAAASRTWSVAANDDDNDGFNSQIDCNDADPSIRPGAIEILDNAVDENCDGVVGTTPPPPVVVSPNTKPEQILVTMAFFSTAGKKTTKFTTLQVKNVPLGATVSVTCKGSGCPSGLKGKGFTKKNAFGTVTLAKFIKKPLKAKDVITVIVSKPNAINAVKILTVRASKKPLITTKCQPPGAKSPVAC